MTWQFVTAAPSLLSSIPGALWMNVPLWANWAILAALCALAGFVMFALLKRINAATENV